MSPPPKLILCVIDAMAPAMLERAVAEGQAPLLGELMHRGHYVSDCVAAFPSVTPVCAASIVTGTGQDRHRIPAMNWYHREEQRYVEYGSSFRAAQRFGIARQLTDTVYNMNRAHLASETPTIFEALDDIQVRTAGTTYLMYRGRHRHEPQRDSTLTRLASTLMRHPVLGPRELFYADIFSSRPTGCRSGLGMPGVRDQHSGCVGSYLVEHDLFDFLLLSLPDNDWHSHKYGPQGQVQSLAQADAQLARLVEIGGGLDAFLDRHAMVVMADHSQALIEHTIDLQPALAELEIAGPTGSRLGSVSPAARRGRGEPRIALCPSQRAAMVYVLAERRRSTLRSSVIRRTLQVDGVQLVMWLELDPHGAPREAVIARPSVGELRFCPEGDVGDTRGRRWSVEGELAVLEASLRGGHLHAPAFPDALARVWSALTCPTSGDVLLSAAPGFEFLDWGRQAHVGGGSHGSLHADDSLGALIRCGLEGVPEREQWAIRDVAPLIARHFGLAPSALAPA
ncbi:MAG TPA: alkaline phosphatase family protein [Solirubrobacteraceae bacterium]|nr:alkaline phosphatase family protein [Solirubrobacteraceae bacterium]